MIKHVARVDNGLVDPYSQLDIKRTKSNSIVWKNTSPKLKYNKMKK